jgi:ABC-type phosphate transport system auxiliary subunit
MRISYEPKYDRIRQRERAILMRKQGKRTPKEAIKALTAAQIIWALRADVKALLIDFNRLPLEYRNLKIEDGIKDQELEAIYGLWLRVEKEKNELQAEIERLKKELNWDIQIRADLNSGLLDYYSGENIKIN